MPTWGKPVHSHIRISEAVDAQLSAAEPGHDLYVDYRGQAYVYSVVSKMTGSQLNVLTGQRRPLRRLASEEHLATGEGLDAHLLASSCISAEEQSCTGSANAWGAQDESKSWSNQDASKSWSNLCWVSKDSANSWWTRDAWLSWSNQDPSESWVRM